MNDELRRVAIMMMVDDGYTLEEAARLMNGWIDSMKQLTGMYPTTITRVRNE